MNLHAQLLLLTSLPMKEQVIKIPTWLFFGISPNAKWEEEKEKLAHSILKHLKEKAEFECWDKSILEKVLFINKYDDCRGYMQK